MSLSTPLPPFYIIDTLNTASFNFERFGPAIFNNPNPYYTLNYGFHGTPTMNSGIIIDRGTSPNAQLLWDEANDFFKAGIATLEKRLATIENAPDNGGIAFWTSSSQAFETNSSLLSINPTTGAVGIGTATPTSILDVTSSTSGVRVPRVSTDERSNITPLSGMLVYDKNFDLFYYGNGSFWSPISGSGIFGLAQSYIPIALTSTSLGNSILYQSGTSTVGIGATSFAASAILELVSTTQGFLPPRFSDTNIANLGTSAVEGLVVFNTNGKRLSVYNGTSWLALGTGDGNVSGSFTNRYIPVATGGTTLGTSIIYQSSINRIGINTSSPSSIFHVYGGASTGIIESTGSGVGNDAVLRIFTSSSDSPLISSNSYIQLGNILNATGSNPRTPYTSWYLGLQSNETNDPLNIPLKIGYKPNAWGVPGDGDIITASTKGYVAIDASLAPSKLFVKASSVTDDILRVDTTSEVNTFSVRGDGIVKLGGSKSSSSNIYPPQTIFSNSQSYYSSYGSGTYTITAGSVQTPNTEYFGVGISLSRFWKSQTNLYDAIGGGYLGTSSTQLNEKYDNLNTYRAEWINIQLPVSMIVKSLSIQAELVFTSSSPRTGLFLGSNDGVGYDILSRLSTVFTSIGQVVTVNLPQNNKSYTHYRIAVFTITGGTTYVSFSFSIYGYESFSNVYVSSSTVGVGGITSTPAAKLHILQDVQNTQDNFLIADAAAGSVGLVYDKFGKLGVGTTPTSNLSVGPGLQVYPPLGLTSSATTLTTAIYANGLYTTSSSSNDSNPEFQAFDKNSLTFWSSAAGKYSTLNGAYLGAVATGPGNYLGEYIQIQLPATIGMTLKYFSLQANLAVNDTPNSFAMFGSNDGVTFVQLLAITYQTFSDSEAKKYFIYLNTTAYTYFRLVVNSTNNGNGKVAIKELLLYGVQNTANPLTVQPEAVGIGTSAPSNNAILDITSTKKGFFPPRMTTADRGNIAVTAADKGLTIFNTSMNYMNVYNGTEWDEMSPGNWSTPTPMTITATTGTQPVKGTITVDYIMSRRITGKYYEVMGKLVNTNGGTRAGGDHLFELPDGLTFASTNGQSFYNTIGTTTLSGSFFPGIVNGHVLIETSNFRNLGAIIPYSSNKFRIYSMPVGGGGNSFVGEGSFFFGNSANIVLTYFFNFFLFTN